MKGKAKNFQVEINREVWSGIKKKKSIFKTRSFNSWQRKENNLICCICKDDHQLVVFDGGGGTCEKTLNHHIHEY